MSRNQIRLMTEQNAQLTRALELSAESDLDALFVAITQAYIDHPDLRSIFNEGEAGLEPIVPDRHALQRASALAEALCDSMERSLKFEHEGLPEITEALRAWVEDSFRRSGFLRQWLHEHKRWYASLLVDVLHDVEHELSTTGGDQPPVAADDPQRIE